MFAAEFQNVIKTYHNQTILKNINFKVEEGRFTVIFGPPGCGKSVILRLLMGLEKPTSGKILMRGEDMSDVPSGARGIGYVPQSFALYPHYKVYDNIAYPLRLGGYHKIEYDPIVRRTSDMLRIKHLLNKYPDQLSGGEKQRVALARGIAKEADIYVFDDPLSGLDFKLREQLIDDLKQMQQSLGATFIYCTSDPLETLMLADYVIIIDEGEVVESGTLEKVYYEPTRLRTMALLGYPKANIMAGELLSREQMVWCKTQLFEFPAYLSSGENTSYKKVVVAIRPHEIKINRTGMKEMSGHVSFKAKVVLMEDLGGELLVHLESGNVPLISVIRHDDVHLVDVEEIDIVISLPSMIIYSNEGFRIGQGAS